MPPLDPRARALARLIEDGQLAASQLSRGARESLRPLFDTGALIEERAGAGRRILVIHPEAVEKLAIRLYPSGLALDEPDLKLRANAVACFRDAKRALGEQPKPLFLRGVGEAALQRGKELLPVARLTEQAGVAAILLDGEAYWGFSGRVVLIENLECFLQAEKLGIPYDLAIYARGRLSQRLLDWLASPGLADCTVTHCGDYDPVGLDEFLRLRAALGRRATLYVPDNLEELVKSYGKRQLLLDSMAVMARIRRSRCAEVRRVIDILDRQNAGLEQEALLLEAHDDHPLA